MLNRGMKFKKTLSTCARMLMLGSASLMLAAPVAEAHSALDLFPALAYHLFKGYDAAENDEDNPWIQELRATLRAQYQWGSIDPNGGGSRVKGGDAGQGRRHNDEWRRFRLGARAKVLRHFTLRAVWNIGGLDTRDRYRNGRWSDGVGSGVVDELFISASLEPVSLTLGKHKPAFIGEYRTSSSTILTLERSNLVNQLAPGKLYGLSVRNADKKATIGWELGTWVNGQHDGLWAEPAFNSGDNVMLGASLSCATGEQGRLWLDYMHSFVNEGRVQADSAYAGPGARDVVALSWEAKAGKLRLMAEALAGFDVVGGEDGAENVWGLVFLPSYRVTEHVEAVFRYQLAAGSNAVGHDSRYVTTNGAFASRCDLLHGVYFGLNIYVCPEREDALRFMLGAEYINSHGRDAAGEKGFSGWNYGAGVRCNF